MTKRILITGGAGFLGSHLCDRFINEGYQVIAMDNLLTGSLDNIAHLFPLKAFEYHHHDVTKFVHVPGPLDYILHFASPASPIDYLKMPIQTLKVGALGTHNLLGLANEKRPVFWWPPPLKCTVIRSSTPKKKTIGVMSIP
jgi:dTDP-glucose 4,6-dehydratase